MGFVIELDSFFLTSGILPLAFVSFNSCFLILGQSWNYLDFTSGIRV